MIKIFNRNMTILILGNSVTKLGNVIFQFALNWWVIQTAGNAKTLGIIAGISIVPSLIANLFSGVIADKFNRKLLIIITDVVSGITCIIFGIYLEDSVVNVPAIIVLNSILSICYALFSPSVKSITPEVVEKKKIKQLNSLLSSISQTIKISGPLIGGLLFSISFIGFKEILIINGISFLLSACLEMLLKYTFVPKEPSNFFIDFKDGFTYVKKNPIMFNLLIAVSLVNFFIAGYNLLLPAFVEYYYKSAESLYSILLTAEAIGGIVGVSLLGMEKTKIVNLQSLIKELLMTGIFFIPLLFFNSFYYVVFATFTFGFFLVRFNTLFFTYIQTITENNYLGRVFSLIFTISAILLPVGYYVFGYLIDFLRLYTFPLIGICIVLINIVLVKAKKLMLINNH